MFFRSKIKVGIKCIAIHLKFMCVKKYESVLIMNAAAQTEEILDQDFSFILSMTKAHYQEIVDEKDGELCRKWLEKLCGKRVEGLSQKRSRNILLSELIVDMQKKKLSERFQTPPADGPLPPTSAIFGFHDPHKVLNSKENDNVGLEDFQERSADGRTYVAIRSLPNSQGTYAFVALNLDKEDDLENKIIIPCSTDKSKLQHLKALRNLQKASSSLGENRSESQREDFYIRNIDAKVPGEISKLREKLSTTCGRSKNEIDFIDLILKQIDEEIKGAVSGDNRLVKFLLSRLIDDLKKMPKMKHIFQLQPDQQILKLLQILRQKLIVRQQEGKRIDIIANMEERMLVSAVQSECSMGEVEESSEPMWKLIITKPLSNVDLERLQSIYPREIISTFLHLLVEDRQQILKRGRKRGNKILESMRSEVYKEINSGKKEYNKAREAYREWNEILSTVEETMYEAEVQESEGKIAEEQSKKIPCQKVEILEEMIANIKETENMIKEEALHGEVLTAEIAAANAWNCSIEEGKDKELWETKKVIDDIKEHIELYKIMIKKQEQRINELRQRLGYD